MTAANDNRFTVADVRRAIKAAEAVGKSVAAVVGDCHSLFARWRHGEG